MFMGFPDDQTELIRLLEENTRIVKENNEILKKIYTWSIVGIVLKIIWYVIIIGFPFAVYFYVLQPYFEALGSNYEVFKAGIDEIPGLKGLGQLLLKVGE